MPLTNKGREIYDAMTRTYGRKKGRSVFYASANKGREGYINGVRVHPAKKNAKKKRT